MNSKRLIIPILTFFLTLSCLTTKAQPPHQQFDYEKFKSEKIAFITKAIELTPAEAEKFWPIHNEFDKHKFDLMKQRRELEEKLKNDKTKLTDKDYIEISRTMAILHKKEGELMIKYNEEFLKVLPPKKVVELYDAESSFRRHLLREYRQRNREEKK